MTAAWSQLSPQTPVDEALECYLRENNFKKENYSAPTFQVKLFGRMWTFPNHPYRQQVIPLHDLHHVATGYGTDLAGEGEIGAWELRGGCNTLFLVVINLLAVFFGFFVAPRRILKALKAAAGQRTLYALGDPYDSYLKLSLEEIRTRLGLPANGVDGAGPS